MDPRGYLVKPDSPSLKTPDQVAKKWRTVIEKSLQLSAGLQQDYALSVIGFIDKDILALKPLRFY
jgi:hypothetical protein